MSTDKSLSHIDRLLPVQGPDPIVDEGHGLQLGRRFGIYGFSPFPKPVAHFLRTKVFAPLLIDPSVDTVFMEKIFMWSLLMVPLWVYLLTTCDYQNHPYWFAACGVLHTLLWLDQFETYVLGLHCVVHRPVWRPGKVADALKAYWVWVLGPMLGETPETYRAHHVMMHHPRNNGYDDLSTTMTYRRDGVWDFARYLGRFLIVHFELYDTLKSSHTKVARRFLWGEICWTSIGLALYWARPLPAICFYFLPILFLRIGMTCGNWGQHAFINDADPFSNFNQSTTIVNSVYNTKAFNDGYHIMHHQYPQAHYTDLPKHFVAMLPELAENDSVVFDARGGFGAICDWPSIWWLLMTGQYAVLADHFVDCRQLADATGKTARRSKEEIIALLKSRTCKVYNRALDGENPNKRAGGSRAARASAAGEISGADEKKRE